MQAAAREQVQAPGMTRPAEGRSSLDCLHDSGHAVIHMLAGLGYARALDMLVAARASPSLQVSLSAAVDILLTRGLPLRPVLISSCSPDPTPLAWTAIVSVPCPRCQVML